MQRYYMPYENTCTYAVCIAGSILISKNVTIQGEILNKLYCQLWDLDINNLHENWLTSFCLTCLVDSM